MSLSASSVIQILVLTTGIYLLMSFLRTTRGSVLIRGLAVASLVVIVGLWALSKYLELDELDHIIEGITGYVVVILAILFQPELRRGIVHLGENPLFGSLLKKRRQEVLGEVAQACITMANKRQGALIAFERKIPLDTFIEGGVKIDAEVNRFLLDSIFHHGSALHDGAVIIRGKRIEAATSLFPLTENVEISKSTGTRHRAALGVTEETDAVTLAVSEETGAISICKAGQMERRIPPTKLEERLREQIGSEDPSDDAEEEKKESLLRDWFFGLFTHNVALKFGALAIACGVFWGAHQDIRESRVYRVTVASGSEGEGSSPTLDRLQIVLPGQAYHLAEPAEGTVLEITVSGKRSRFEQLSGRLGGVLLVSPDIAAGSQAFPLAETRWGAADFIEGLDVTWNSSPEPLLAVEQFRSRGITLEAEHIIVNDDDLNPRYQARADEVTISPKNLELKGPVGLIDKLNTPELPLRLGPIVLGAGDSSDREDFVGLTQELVDAGIGIVGRSTVQTVIMIVPAAYDLGTIERDIVPVSFDANRSATALRWRQPTQKAVFRVMAAGVLPEADPSSDIWTARTALVRQFVVEHLRVFVDVDVMEASGGRLAQIEWEWSKDWREELPVEMGTSDLDADLWVELESDSELLLNEK